MWALPYSWAVLYPPLSTFLQDPEFRCHQQALCVRHIVCRMSHYSGYVFSWLRAIVAKQQLLSCTTYTRPAFCCRMSLPPHVECVWESAQPYYYMCKPGSVKESTHPGSRWISAPLFWVSSDAFFIASQKA